MLGALLLPFDAAEAAADPHDRGRGAAGSWRGRQCALKPCSLHRRQSSSRCRRLPSKPPRLSRRRRRLPPLRRQQLQRRPAPRSHLQRAAPTKAQSRKSPAPACSRRRRRSNIRAGRGAIPGLSVASNPEDAGLTSEAWGGADGPFLSTLMRRMRTPLASRWAHIALRDALLSRIHAPVNVNPVDWVAERAWLLLRLGEADAARMLVADVDVDRFTPKMVQVAVQSALANADAPALCPLEDGIRNMIRASFAWSRRCAHRSPASPSRIGDDRPGAPLWADRRGRPRAGRESRRRGRKRARVDHRMGAGRFADGMAVWSGDRNRRLPRQTG